MDGDIQVVLPGKVGSGGIFFLSMKLVDDLAEMIKRRPLQAALEAHFLIGMGVDLKKERFTGIFAEVAIKVSIFRLLQQGLENAVFVKFLFLLIKIALGVVEHFLRPAIAFAIAEGEVPLQLRQGRIDEKKEERLKGFVQGAGLVEAGQMLLLDPGGGGEVEGALSLEHRRIALPHHRLAEIQPALLQIEPARITLQD